MSCFGKMIEWQNDYLKKIKMILPNNDFAHAVFGLHVVVLAK